MIMRTLLPALVCAALAGCGSPMIHTSTGSGQAITDPGLAGEWAAAEPLRMEAVIAADEARSPAYTASLTVYDEGEVRSSLGLELTLTEIGGAAYADLFLGRGDRDALVGRYGFLAVPVHQLVKVDRDGDTLVVRPFRGEWVDDRTRSAGFTHDRVAVGGGEVVLVTARTEQLREFIAKNANNPAAFGDPIVFRRVGK